MTSEVEIAWFAGLFEGEGSFCFSGDTARSMQLTSTDFDVLTKIVNICGGSITKEVRLNAPPHWKPAWKWYLGPEDSILLAETILPHLGIRRTERALVFLESLKSQRDLRNQGKVDLAEKHTKIVELYSSGLYTQTELAKSFGYTRTHISKIVNGHRRVVQ